MELQQYFILDVNLYRINLYLYQPAGRSLILKNCLTFFNLTDFQIIRVDVMYILFALRIHHENFIGKYNTIQCNDCFPGFDKDDVKIWIALKGDYSVNYMDELTSESVRDLRDTRDTDRESISIVALQNSVITSSAVSHILKLISIQHSTFVFMRISRIIQFLQKFVYIFLQKFSYLRLGNKIFWDCPKVLVPQSK